MLSYKSFEPAAKESQLVAHVTHVTNAENKNRIVLETVEEKPKRKYKCYGAARNGDDFDEDTEMVTYAQVESWCYKCFGTAAKQSEIVENDVYERKDVTVDDTIEVGVDRKTVRKYMCFGAAIQTDESEEKHGDVSEDEIVYASVEPWGYKCFGAITAKECVVVLHNTDEKKDVIVDCVTQARGDREPVRKNRCFGSTSQLNVNLGQSETQTQAMRIEMKQEKENVLEESCFKTGQLSKAAAAAATIAGVVFMIYKLY